MYPYIVVLYVQRYTTWSTALEGTTLPWETNVCGRGADETENFAKISKIRANFKDFPLSFAPELCRTIKIFAISRQLFKITNRFNKDK